MGAGDAPIVILILTSGMLVKLGSMDAGHIQLTYMMEGSRQRSLWAVARHHYAGTPRRSLKLYC